MPESRPLLDTDQGKVRPDPVILVAPDGSYYQADGGGGGGGGDASAANQVIGNTRIGATNETSAAADNSDSGINGLIKRQLARLTVFMAQFPATLGAKARTASLGVALSTEDQAVQVAIRDGILSTAPVGVFGGAQAPQATMTLDTNIYAPGDLLCDVQAVDAALRAVDASGFLVNLVVVDEDDQKPVMDIYFTNSLTSWGAENSPPTITGVVARSILGRVPIVAADYEDLGGVSMAIKAGLGQVLKAIATTDDIGIAIVLKAGTPTFTANGIKINLGVLN